MLFLALCASCALEVQSAPRQDVLDRVQKEKPAVIETLREIVGIDSGSRDKPGLDKLAALIGSRLEALGAKVERASGTAEVIELEDTPKEIGDIVIGRLTGKGTRDILLLAHMDTVYPPGTVAKLPFRIDGNLAYGPGIADDKAGVALILHTLALLKAQGFDDYRKLTIVINGDEEISSPGSRKVIERVAAEHEVVFSCEPTPVKIDRLDIATSGIASASMIVHGRSSHAGAAPELGRNALTELAHRLLQLGDLSDPSRGIKFNWTMAQAGTTRNVIPDRATAMADVRVQKLDRLRGDRTEVPRDGERAGARPRHEGRDQFPAAPAAARGNRRLAGAGAQGPGGLRRTREETRHRRLGQRRRHGRCVRCVVAQTGRARKLRLRRRELSLERGRIHRPRLDRAATVPADADGHGLRAGQIDHEARTDSASVTVCLRVLPARHSVSVHRVAGLEALERREQVVERRHRLVVRSR